MLHGLFYFPKAPMSDRYDMGMSVGYVSDNLTQFQLLDVLSFIIFEGRKSSQAKKVLFLAFRMEGRQKMCIFP